MDRELVSMPPVCAGDTSTPMAGLGIFGVGSALCALAPSMAALIGFRVLQGQAVDDG
jgi:MFS family permease